MPQAGGLMIVSTVLLALREIRRNILRSLLTMLGVVIGVAAVIAMVTLGGGATARVTADIASMGRNLLIVVPGGERHMGTVTTAPSFWHGDAEAIARDVAGASKVAATASQPVLVIHGNTNWPTLLTGGDAAYLDIREWPLASGRSFDAAESRVGRPVCILGATVRDQLFGSQDPIGAAIRIDQMSCLVIGVLRAKGQTTFGADQDDLVLVPLRTFQRRIAGSFRVGAIYVAAAEDVGTEKVQEDVAALLRQRRRIPAGQKDNFLVRDMKEVAETVERVTGVMTALLGAIAAISLVVGGIGIMNIMLVSVTERTREIGIRLAIGAREGDVLKQFLVEAIALSILGGLAGIVLGIGCSLVAARLLGIPFVFNPLIVAVAIAFAAAIGVAFGYLPARRAARLDPIEALRHE
jgi:putative ABC transport system permease protein